jgi:hypothetical protein
VHKRPLRQVFLRVLRLSPVSIIPPFLHTHSFIYNRRCIMFLSQYFSFPCQYHTTNATYSFIYLPSTLYNVSLPVLQFSPVSIIPLMLHTSFHLNTIIIRRTSGRGMGTFKVALFWILWTEVLSHCSFFMVQMVRGA